MMPRVNDIFPGPGTPEFDQFEGTPFHAIQRLGSGGMGDAWLVEHQGTRRLLVAKVVHERVARDPRLLHRSRIEIDALSRLAHAHIVQIVDCCVTADGRPFIVMEYLRGRSVRKELDDRGPLGVFEAVTYTCQLLSALGAAHAIGIVHRDIKPDNLFICDWPEGGRYLKVLDFGIARVLPGTTAVTPLPDALRTETGTVVGTPRYVSPEGALGEHVDERADLYCAGLVLYAMLVGRGPFDHLRGSSDLLAAHAAQEPQPPSHFAGNALPAALDAIVLKALAKDPAARYQSAREFQAVLEPIAAQLHAPAGWTDSLDRLPDWQDGQSGERPASLHADGTAAEHKLRSIQTAPTAPLPGVDRVRPPEVEQGSEARRPSGLHRTVQLRSAALIFVLGVVLIGLTLAGLYATFRKFHGAP